MIVEVVWQDIALGIRQRCNKCPIALALMRVGKQDVSVDGFAISFWEGDKWHDYRTPISALHFIGSFDRGEDVEPFSFEMHPIR